MKSEDRKTDHRPVPSLDEQLDEALSETFPASDPIAVDGRPQLDETWKVELGRRRTRRVVARPGRPRDSC